MDDVLNALDFSNQTILKYLSYDYPKAHKYLNKNAPKFDEFDGKYLLGLLLKEYRFDNLKKIVSIIGENNPDFIQSASKLNNQNLNALEHAILNKEESMYEYLVSMDGIKDLYQNENDQSVKQSIYRILYILFVQSSVDDEAIESVIKSLNLKTETIADFMSCQYPESEQKDDEKQSFADYKVGHNIIGQLTSKQSVDRLKKLESIIGQKALMQYITVCDEFGVNAFEYSIRTKKENTIKYLIKF